MKKTVRFAVIAFLLFVNGIIAQSKKGQVVAISIEGAQDTEMGAFKNGKMVEDFNGRIKEATLSRLKELFQLNQVVMAPDASIVFKQGLNRLSGVGKLDKNQKETAKEYSFTFKIKCDIAFNETVGGFIIDETSSRAAIYVNVGVYDSNGERVAIYKGKCKDSVVFLGKNARKVQWLAKEDFETAYQSALEDLKEK